MYRLILFFCIILESNILLHANRISNEYSKSFVFIIPAYNVKEWYRLTLDSIFIQTYDNWRAIYIDDYSSDGSGSMAYQYIQERGFQHKVTFIQNTQRDLALSNIYYAVHSCRDDEIILLLDGDDWLARPDVLEILNSVYQDANVWITYGSYRWHTELDHVPCMVCPNWVIEQSAYRQVPWFATCLRTFYAWLFKKINKEDLLYQGQFWPMAWDLAIMFPLLEMAAGRFRRITQILYVYNIGNPLSDSKNSGLQLHLDALIRKQEKYAPLDSIYI